MICLPKPLTFQWDQGNLDKNPKKHHVTNQEAEEVFANQPLVINTDTPHSINEPRYYALGRTNQNRPLFLSFTIRKNQLRLISVRDMSRKERRVYEKA